MLEITKELIYKLIHEFASEAKLPDVSVSLSEYIAKRIKEIQSVEHKIYSLQTDARKIEEEYLEKLKENRSKISEVRKLCKHELTTRHPDASGNNDSWTSCNLCGEEVS